MDYFADITLLILMAAALLIMFFYDYPARWQDRKLIFGVRNRDEFKEEKASSAVSRIVSETRKQALIILIISFILMGLIFLIPDVTVRITIWVVFIIMDLVLITVPFMRSNREMKSLKREIGIKSEQGTTYTDLKAAGSVSALNITALIIPDLITLLAFITALLYDLGVITLPGLIQDTEQAGSFALTSMTATFLFIGLMLIPIAIMMDRTRNEVISSDSDMNHNYNRAKKKVFADMFVFMSWANAIVAVLYAVLLFFIRSDVVLIIQMMVYVILIVAGLAMLVRKSLAVDRHYRKETTIAVDDDDHWILGSFYYNPDDRRLNVTKRMGIGGTINIGHPAGKVIMIVTALFLIIAIVFVISISAFAKSGMKVSVGSDTLVCNQVIDYYKIPLADISEAEICEMNTGFHLTRQVGIGMPPVFIGTFIVNGENNCNIFLNMGSDSCIRFKSGGITYYISGNSSSETAEIFEKMGTAKSS